MFSGRFLFCRALTTTAIFVFVSRKSFVSSSPDYLNNQRHDVHLSATCSPGSYLSAGSCVSCVAGKYSGIADASACTPAPTGTLIFWNRFTKKKKRRKQASPPLLFFLVCRELCAFCWVQFILTMCVFSVHRSIHLSTLLVPTFSRYISLCLSV